MIGYKTYAQLPAEDIPVGMPPEYPWISNERIAVCKRWPSSL
jgi:hypothetical protein